MQIGRNISSNKRTVLMLLVLVSTLLLAGGFYVWVSAIISIALIVGLFLCSDEIGIDLFKKDLIFIGALLIPFAFLLEMPFAVDRGEAVIGFVKYLPLPLFCLVLRSMESAERKKLWRMVPLAGTAMTVLSVLLTFFSFREYLLVNGRLAGFFQYPNTYAAYLLCGILCILSDVKDHHFSILYISQFFILVAGIILSGSRTVIVFLILLALFMAFRTKSKRKYVLLGTLVAAGILSVGALFLLGKSEQLSRYLVLPWQSSTFLGRLLYWKDAFPVILQHPFGLGYLGYYFLQGSFQTGVYTTRYIHNELLQLLLDVGWIPSAVLIYAIASEWKHGNVEKRIMLTVLIGHALMDFDFQFLAMDMLLIMALYIGKDKSENAKKRFPLYGCICISVILCCIAFMAGFSDVFLQLGSANTSLHCYPLNSEALMVKMAQTDGISEAAALADKILAINDSYAPAYCIKASSAYMSGNGADVIKYQRKAIELSPYDITQYEVYLSFLATLHRLYVQENMQESATITKSEILSVPDWLEAVKSRTSSLGWQIADQPNITLPEQYLDLIENIRNESLG